MSRYGGMDGFVAVCKIIAERHGPLGRERALPDSGSREEQLPDCYECGECCVHVREFCWGCEQELGGDEFWNEGVEMKRSSIITGTGLHRPCPPEVGTATDYYEGGGEVNEGICVGCGCPLDEHGPAEAVVSVPAGDCT